jgi:hypothetical protein
MPNSKLLATMTNVLKNDRWRTTSLRDMGIKYEIKDGRLWINDPIVLNIPPVRMEISGDQGLDTTLNYKIAAAVPVSIIGSGATDLLSRIPGGSRVDEIKLSGFIRGTARNPDISLSAADTAASITTAVREQVTETVTEKVEEVKTQVNEEINRQIEQMMAEAQRQADNLRNSAKQTADRLRREANSAADRLISEASGKNAIERRLAQTAADKLRSEGEASAKKLEDEAENQARAAMAVAERKADELRRD